MASDSENVKIKDLTNKRSNVKGRLTKFKNHIEALQSQKAISELDISKLTMRSSRMESLFIEFDELQAQLESLNQDNLDSELTIRDGIEQDFDHYISIAKSMIAANSTHENPNSEYHSNNSTCSSHCHDHSDSNVLGFKLPVIKIPNFDGTYYKWLEFKETFSSLIHDNKRLKNIHKFHYLNSYLEGEAARVLCNFEVTDKNYNQAWQLLCERYDNKRQLINNHLKSLFDIESVRETDKSLRFIIDHVTKNLRALSTLGLPTDKWDVLIIYMVTAKLDNTTCFKWEEHRNILPEIPTLDNFFTFLKNRADVLETVNSNRQDKPKQSAIMPPPNKFHTKSFVATANGSPPKFSFECVVCKGSHRLFECSAFKAKSPEDRNSIVSSQKLCENCLRPSHTVETCRLPGSCRFCKQRHNSLLHVIKAIEITPPNDSPPQTVVMSALSHSSQVLLCTAKVHVSNPITNEAVTVRALLDCGSQSSFITESIKQKLSLSPQPSDISIVGIGNTQLTLNTERCALRLKSHSSSFNVIMTCLVLPKISDELPKVAFDSKPLDLSNFTLADPSFNEPSSIDMLIGADLFWDLIGSKQHSLGSQNPILRSSKLGWLIAGPMSIARTPNSINKTIVCHALLKEGNLPNLESQVAKFWELESFSQSTPYTKEEKLCEQHFLSTTTRLNDGRFCVGLPLRDDRDCLGDSYQLAKKRLLNLEARFRKQPELKKLYSEFIHEYADLGHLSNSTIQRPIDSYFLPHHPVIREKSESTKLRVVFDASARTTSGISVNDLQVVGPTVQDSLFNILIRFRLYKYIVSGDVEKMYRQVTLRESDRNLQLILWRDNENEEIRTLQLNTVTYGFASASFLSTRCLWQLGEECSDPKIKTIIQKDMYCDDLLTGCNTEDELRYIQRSVSQELAKGCFNLRKYRSNFPQLFSTSDLNPEEGNLLISNSTCTLGIGWSPSSDNLHFQVEPSIPAVPTKRSILSTIFKIFDPLGLLSLYTIKPKILLQTLWTQKLDWDEPVPNEINSIWQSFSQNLHTLSSLTVPRNILIDDATAIELHCFVDASEKAYGACIYLKSTNDEGNSHVNLLCAKARVAPLKATTIPRLELCAAVLGAQLGSAVAEALRCSISRHVYWTDSRVVLGWINSSNKTKTFVANRIAAINELTESSSWRHVPTSENPADLASRGVELSKVVNSTEQSSLWWHGPSFLSQTESSWPSSKLVTVDLPEEKAISALVVEVAPLVPVVDFKKFSKFTKLQRVYATVFRFLNNCQNPNNKCVGSLLVNELENSIKFLITIAQKESFPNEISRIKNNKPLLAKASLSSLSPFLDSKGLLRVGGRISNSNHPYDKKHPILLKAEHPLSKLIFTNEHERLLHAGPQQILASIRERYWPIGGRNLARSVARNCLRCRRFKGQTLSNIMGNLPTERVEPDFPFCTVATDFAGPFYITDRKGRGCKITKCYMCIFVCLRYKCIHLEAVSELSKDAFLLTLKRFIARRGMPKIIYCDNGRNFVAAAKEIGSFLQSNHDSICDFAARRGIEFRFSPAYAPHFNGLAEAGVKSAKFHIHRVLGNSHLTFEELSSLLAQVEAILNSRPLCPLSPSPHDFQPLTPAHFLIGRPLTSLPSPSLMDSNTNRLDRFQRLEQVKQHFWKRWATEYIAELQQRTKWRTKCRDLKVDDLVLLKDESVPPLCWRLGRVSKLFPGSDGVPRVADVSTSQGTVRRAINRICLLPTSDDQLS